MSSLTSLPLQISNPLFDNNFTMNELPGAGEGDLEAVVRGCTNGFSTSFTTDTIQPDFVFSSNFPDFFDQTSSILDELEQLYKPFYPMLNPISPQTSTSLSSISNSVSSREVREPKMETGTDQSPVLVGADSTTVPAVKYKRRKTQHKRVELQVTAEGLSSDVWAWRKYGQKPIKGSPYPRSYYRCSSKKGCLARKQVERSHSDPKMFIITYTAEHCHSQPTRRSSLAGTTRLKFSTPKGSTTANDLNPPIPKDSSSSPISSAAEQSSDSPPTPLSDLATRELQEFSELQPMNKKSIEEEKQDDQEMDIGNEHINNGLVMCDTIWSDDFLLGYDELDRLPFDLPYNGFLDEQFPMAFPW